MKMNAARFCKRLGPLILMTGFFASHVEAQLSRNVRQQEQDTFRAASDTVDRPVKLPEGLLKTLRNDASVDLVTGGLAPDQLPPAGWFLASEIHLAGPDEVDLVVEGVGKLRGSIVCPFWVFGKTSQGYHLILRAALEQLKVLDSRSSGYRDIQAWITIPRRMRTIMLFKFDGHQYQLAKSVETPPPPEPQAQEQTIFSSEDDSFDRPAKLPGDVLRIMRDDGHVLIHMKGQNIPPDQLPPAEWFLASEVHLASPDELDLMVMGTNGLRGASVCTFWIFRKTTEGYELALDIAAHDLKVLDSRSAGYRDIQAWTTTAVTRTMLLFRFDGHRYQVVERKTEP